MQTGNRTDYLQRRPTDDEEAPPRASSGNQHTAALWRHGIAPGLYACAVTTSLTVTPSVHHIIPSTATGGDYTRPDQTRFTNEALQWRATRLLYCVNTHQVYNIYTPLRQQRNVHNEEHSPSETLAWDISVVARRTSSHVTSIYILYSRRVGPVE